MCKLIISAVFFIITSCEIAFSQYRYNYLERGIFQLEKKNYAEAINLFNEALESNLNQCLSYYHRSVAKYYLNDLIGAEEDANKAIKLFPYHPRFYLLRAVIYWEMMQLNEALNDYEKGLNYDSSFVDIYFQRSLLYLDSRQYEKALEDCNKVIELDNDYKNAFVVKGAILINLSEYEEAMTNINIDISRDSLNEVAYIQRGIAYSKMHQIDSAIADFNKVLEIDSTNLLALYQRAIAKMDIPDNKGALKDFNKVIELSPDSEYTLFGRALLQSNLNEDFSALADYQNILRLNPDNIFVHYNIGITQYRIGDLNAALASFNNAIELYPNFIDAYSARATVKFALGDITGANRDLSIKEKITSKIAYSTDSLKYKDELQILKLTSFSDDLTSNKNKKGMIQYNQIDIHLKGIYLIAYLLYTNSELYAYAMNQGKRNEEIITLVSAADIIDPFELFKQIGKTDSLLNTDKNSTIKNLLKRGVLQSHANLFDRAIADFNDVLLTEKENTSAYFCRANTRLIYLDKIMNDMNARELEMKVDKDMVRIEVDLILHDYNKVIELDPGFVYAIYNRAYAKYLIEDYTGALSDYSKVIEKKDLSAAYYNKGLLSIFLNDKEEGCYALSKAGELGIPESYYVIKRYCGN